MTAATPSSAWKIHPRVRFRRVLDEAVVIHQQRAEALVLNDTAAAFLELCDGARGFEEIIDRMAAEYDVDEETLRQDVAAFARELMEEGIIETT